MFNKKSRTHYCTALNESGLSAFDFDHFAASVMTAIRAHVMRKMLIAAIRAVDQMTYFKRVVSSSAIASALGDLALGYSRHNFTPFVIIQTPTLGQASSL